MLSTSQAAAILKVTPRRVLALISSGQLPAQMIGHYFIISTGDLDKVKDRKPGRPKAKGK